MKKKKADFQRRFSAGGVVFRRKNSDFEILLLKRKKRDGKFEWVLPKGEIEEDNIKKTALREIKEETGLENLELIARLGQEKYFYRESWDKGNLIFKIVTYFLVESQDEKTPQPQIGEGFVEARWFPHQRAIERATFQNSQEIIKRAVKLIKTLT